MPRELEIELTTEDQLSQTTLRPRGAVLGRTGQIDFQAFAFEGINPVDNSAFGFLCGGHIHQDFHTVGFYFYLVAFGSTQLETGLPAVVDSEVQGEVVMPLKISDSVRSSPVYVPKGAWLRSCNDGSSINVLIPGHTADIAAGAGYNDTQVDIESAG